MTEDKEEDKSVIGVFGMGVMGQNLALNVASKSFKVSCYNREDEFSMRLFEALEIAKRDISNGDDLLRVFKDLSEFVDSLKKPRYVLFFFVALSFVVRFAVRCEMKYVLTLVNRRSRFFKGEYCYLFQPGNQWR